MRVVCVQLQNERVISAEHLAEIFYRATPQIMVRKGGALFLEIAKCANLYSETSFLRRARLTLERLGASAQIAVADDIPTAFCFAFFQQKDKNRLPIEALRFYIDPFQDSPDLIRAIETMVLNLRRLGVKTLKDYAELPAREVSSRFGGLGLMGLFRVLGQGQVVWKNFVPSETVREREEFDLESPADNLEPILFRLKASLDRVHLRLRGRGRRVKKLAVVLRQEHALKAEERDRRLSVYLQLPHVAAKTVFQITKEKMEAEMQARPLRHRVAEFEVIVEEDVPYFMAQKNLLDQKKEETEETHFAVVSRLATRLGENRVFFAEPCESYLPEKTWRRSTQSSAFGGERSHLPERPLRLLRSPVAVKFSGSRLATAEFADEVQEITQPETVFSHWWEDLVERTYAQIVTREGRHLWVFKNQDGCFLHGVFD